MTSELRSELDEAFAEAERGVTEHHPALVRWVNEHEHGPDTVNHPLLCTFAWPAPVASLSYRNIHKEFKRLVRDDQLETALSMLVANPYRVNMLWSWCKGGKIDHFRARGMMLEAWSQTEFPWQCEEQALELFEACGYLSDGAPLPKESMRVYRGTRDEYPSGLAWTESVDVALWFARRWRKGDETGYIHTAEVDPTEMLARFNGRNEYEVVVNTDLLLDIETEEAR